MDSLSGTSPRYTQSNSSNSNSPPREGQALQDSPATRGSQPLGAGTELDQSIRNLAQGLDPFDELLRRARKLDVGVPLSASLTNPEALLDLSDISALSVLANVQLSPSHRLFQTINAVIGQAEESYLGLDKERQEVLEAIVMGYKTYVEKVCDTLGADRVRLIKGLAHVQTTEFSFKVKQKVARQMVSLSRYGPPSKSNKHGASLVNSVGRAHFKAEYMNPLNPGKEFCVTELRQLVMHEGSPPTQLIKISNVWTRNADSEAGREHPSRGELTQSIFSGQASPAQAYEQYFREHSEVKKGYPFELLRECAIVQVAKTITGENLYEQLRGSSEVFISNFTTMLLLELISGPNDARSDNFMNGEQLCCIDNDGGLSPELVRDSSGRHKLGIKSILFFLPQMNDRLVDDSDEYSEGIRYFLSKKPGEILIDWLVSLNLQNTEYDALLSESVLTRAEFQHIGLPISLDKAVIPRLYRVLSPIQNLLRERPDCTHWDVVAEVFPVLTHCAKEILRRASNDPIKAQDILFGYSSTDENAKEPFVEELLSDERLSELEPWLRQPPPSTEPQNIAAAMQSLLCLVPTETHVLERIAPLPWVTHLPVHDSAIGDADLVRLLRVMPHLKSVHIRDCPHITKEGIMDIVRKCPALEVTLGDTPSLGEHDLYDTVQYCWQRHRPIYFDVGEKVCVLPELLDEGFYAALVHQAPKFAETYHLLQASPRKTTPEGTLLHAIAEQDCPQSLDFLLQKINEIDVRGKNKQTPMHFAAAAGRNENLSLLIQHGDSIEALDNRGRTPLHLAVFHGQEECARYLVEQQASLGASTGDRENVLHLCCAKGPFSLVKWLLECVDRRLVNSEDAYGKQPLHHAAMGGSPEIVDLLLRSGANPDVRESTRGYSPLHLAAKYEHIASFWNLLEQGADLLLKDNEGRTPLETAIYYGKDNVVRKLVDPMSPYEEALEVPERDREQAYSARVQQALQEGNRVDQILFLEKLGQHLASRERYVEAASYCSGALGLAQQLNTSHAPLLVSFLLSKLENIEMDYANRALQIKISRDYQNHVAAHRRCLQEVRDEVSSKLPTETLVPVLCSTVSEGYRRRLTALAKDVVKLVGPLPADCTLFVMGAVARDEVCPYSPVQVGFLVGRDGESIRRYCTTFIQLLQLKTISMGETPLVLSYLSTPDANSNNSDSQPASSGSMVNVTINPVGFRLASDGASTPETIIETPTNLAKYQAETTRDSRLAVGLRFIAPLLEQGTPLVQRYQAEVDKLLREKSKLFGMMGPYKVKDRGLSLLREAARNAKQPRPRYDVQEAVCRPLEDILEGLSLVYALKSSTSLDRISEMVNGNLLTSTGGQNLSRVFATVTRLRIAAHLHHGCDNGELDHPELGSAENGQKFTISDRELEMLSDAYRVFIPLLDAVDRIIRSQGEETPLRTDPLYLTEFEGGVRRYLAELGGHSTNSSRQSGELTDRSQRGGSPPDEIAPLDPPEGSERSEIQREENT